MKFGNQVEFMNFPIIGNASILSDLSKDSLIINNVHSSTKSRKLVNNIITNAGFCPKSVIFPEINLNYVNLGTGVFIHEGVLLGANTVIGDTTSIKIGATISHDVIIENNVFIGPRSILCGHVKVSSGAYIGANSVIKEGVKIGKNAVIGAGSVVLNDVEPNTVVVGNPASFLRNI